MRKWLWLRQTRKGFAFSPRFTLHPAVLILTGVILLPPSVTDNCLAAEFKVLHAFKGGRDGQWPQAGLAADKAGDLFGTTYGGGGTPDKHCGRSCGNAYSLSPTGGEQVIYSFTGIDGALPGSPLLVKGHTLYGTTYLGGTSNSSQCKPAGCGVVFALDKHGNETVLYSFCQRAHCADGAFPVSSLIMDGNGNLYGTTSGGGIQNQECGDIGCGTVFRVAPDGSESVLYSFCRLSNCEDGYGPTGGLIFDRAGNLYGTTSFGGASTLSEGTIFKLAADGAETVLHSFCTGGWPACVDGSEPEAGLIMDKAGNFYGTTALGGGTDCEGGQGCGVVFKFAPDGTLTVLHVFPGGDDGALPEAPVIMDDGGNLYGTTVGGGGTGCYNGSGCGTVFRLAPNGKETILHAFCSEDGCADGEQPQAGLVLEENFLFGTALYGGRQEPDCFNFGCGTVFKVRK